MSAFDLPSFDLVVLGGGPAGTSGTLAAALLGKRVALVEQAAVLGGAGVNTGTIPSKTLRETALLLSGGRSRQLLGVGTCRCGARPRSTTSCATKSGSKKASGGGSRRDSRSRVSSDSTARLPSRTRIRSGSWTKAARNADFAARRS